MGDWWNPVDDWKRAQQGLNTLEQAGEVAVQVGQFLLQEGIVGLEDLIPDLVRIVQEAGEDPLDTIRELVDHIRRVGLDVGTVFRELIQGISAYGVEGYGRHMIMKVIGPYQHALSQVQSDAAGIAQTLIDTVNEVSRRLEPLYGAPVAHAAVAAPHAGAFQGRFAAQSLVALNVSQANMTSLAGTFNGDASGYTIQDALRDAQTEMNNTVGLRIAIVVLADIVMLAMCLGVDAATGGIALVATPAEIGGIAVIDLLIWFYPVITHLLKWLILAIGAALAPHHAVSVSTPGDIPWTLPDGKTLEEQFRNLAKRIWYKYKDALGVWFSRIIAAYLACHFSETEINAFLAIVVRIKEFSEGLSTGTTPDVLWNEGDETIQDILAALSPLKPTNERSQAENIMAAIMMIGPQNVRGFGKKFKYQPDPTKPALLGDIDIIAADPKRYIEVGGASKGWPDEVEPGKRLKSIAQWEKEKGYAESQGAIAQLYIQDPGPNASSVDRASFKWAVETAQNILGAGNVFVLPSAEVC